MNLLEILGLRKKHASSERTEGTTSGIDAHFETGRKISEYFNLPVKNLKKTGNKILIADDEPDILTLVSLILKPEGYETIFAETGLEAIEKIYKEMPDLVILDVLMPGGHGYHVLKYIRDNKDEEIKRISVIMLSAKSYAEDKRRGLDAGANAYITKPFDPDELVKKVNEFVRPVKSAKRGKDYFNLP